MTALNGVSSDDTDLEFTLTSGVDSGDSFTFRIAAKNDYGLGEFSDDFTVKAATIPSKISPVAVT